MPKPRLRRLRHKEIPDCLGCDFNDGRKKVFAFGKTDRPDIAFIAEAPGETEVALGQPLIGKSGKFLRMTLKDLGIEEDRCFFTNVCLCRPKGNKKPTASVIRSCLPRLVAEIAKVRPKLVVALGTVASTYVAGHKRGITWVHGIYREVVYKPKSLYGLPAHVVGVVPTYHPSGVLRGQYRFPDFVDELAYAKTILDGEPAVVEPPYDNYVYVETQSEFEAFLKKLRLESFVAVDLETDGMDWFTDKILCIGFSWEREHAWIVDWQALIEQNHENLQALNFALASVALAFQNGVFDMPFLLHAGLTNANYRVDTMQAHFLLDERRGTHGLERLAVKYYRAPDYKARFRETLGLRKWVEDDEFAVLVARTSKDTLFDYNGADVDYTYRLAIDLVDLVRQEDLIPVLRDIEMPAARMVVEFMMDGMLVDRDYFEKVGQQWSKDEDRLAAEIRAAVGDPDFNPASPKQLAHYMYDVLKLAPFGGRKQLGKAKIDEGTISKAIQTVKDDPEAREYWSSKRTTMSSGMKGFGGSAKGIAPRTTAAYMLYWLRQQHDFPDLILKWRYVRKRRGLYYDGLKALIYSDGRIRPRYNMTATVTGRKQTSKPAIHNLIRGDLIYNLFIPDPGWCLIHADYSQAELRILAHYSGNEALIRVLNETDIHTTVAQELFDLSDADIKAMGRTELSDKRIAAKMFSYGILYGRSTAGMAPQLGVSLKEAREYQKRYYSLFPGLEDWVVFQRTEGVRNHAAAISIFGRKRRFPFISDGYHRREVERQAGNFPMQSGSNDLTLFMWVRCVEQLREAGIPTRPWPHIHDSGSWSVPIPFWEKAVFIVNKTMLAVPFETSTIFPADIEVGVRWGDMITVYKRGQQVEADLSSLSVVKRS